MMLNPFYICSFEQRRGQRGSRFTTSPRAWFRRGRREVSVARVRARWGGVADVAGGIEEFVDLGGGEGLEHDGVVGEHLDEGVGLALAAQAARLWVADSLRGVVGGRCWS